MTYDTSTPRGTDTHVRLVSASLRLCVSASLRHPYSKLGGAARPTRDRALRPASALERVERRRVSFFPSLFIRVVVVLLRFATPNILGRREGFGFGSAAPASERATRGLGVVFVTRQERDALG